MSLSRKYEPWYEARPCPCNHPNCKSWHVWPCASVQGVSFTEEEAKAVASMLNKRRHQMPINEVVKEYTKGEKQ